MIISKILISDDDASGKSCSSLSNSGIPLNRKELPNPLLRSCSSSQSNIILPEKPSPINYSQPNHQRNTSLPRKRRRSSKYSDFEVKSLLDVIGGTTPRSDKEWDTVRRLHLLYSNQERSTRSLKKKIHNLKAITDPLNAASNCVAGSQLLMKSLVSSQLLPDFTRTTSANDLRSANLTLHRVPRMYSLTINPVPNPLLTTASVSERAPGDGPSEVPNVISIPASPESGIVDLQDDDISELDLDDKSREDEDHEDF
jgi:hypothetical protein